ncbi:unnamed protein product [Phytophthora fragariaefolia]|uniref:Unnamed protein product n=1 Tax=Phytophthora fragariaefolia TaxID=1490495 RepID=A0A9W6Y349_9STRA|nr:unnamed protein product [Phytophthora fragariaefolia]
MITFPNFHYVYTYGARFVADIRVLELERKRAMGTGEAAGGPGEAAAEGARRTGEGGEGRRPIPTQKRSRAQHEEAAQDARSENRCIFTPIKKARKYDQLPSAVQRAKPDNSERPPSSIASGVDMLFFK